MNPADSDSSEEIDDDFGGNSEPDVEVASTFDEVIAPIGVDCARASMARGFWSLDQATLDTEFRSRGCLMRVVPKVMRGAARAAGNVEQETRAWKLFMLVPRMLITKTPSRWCRVQRNLLRVAIHSHEGNGCCW